MPARLACVKPAASVRSEPGSNSQVGLETSNRLITTFDEVPPYLSTAIHIAADTILRKVSSSQNHGVTYVNVYRRSLSSSLDPLKIQILLKPRSSHDRDSQGLRRPRFSFFILTCQTARSARLQLPTKEVLAKAPPDDE